jgi:hypothetical protein
MATFALLIIIRDPVFAGYTFTVRHELRALA